MKKILALLLAILMITVVLTSCKTKQTTTGGNNNNDPETSDDGLIVPGSQTTDSGTGTTDTTDTDTADTSNEDANGGQSGSDFENVTAFSVYPYTTVKIRSSNSMDASGIVSVAASTAITVTAKKGDTWYKVKYVKDGTTYEGYVPQDFVSANKNDTVFTNLASDSYKKITIKGDAENPYGVNIRQFPIISDYLSQEQEVLTYAETSAGELVKIGESASGLWYKVKYNNKEYFLKVNSGTRPYLIVDGTALETEADGI